MTKQDLIDILASIKSSFSQDELAYLAVTRKVEDPLRDATAYRMHVKYQSSLLVCRESLNRFDIAANNPISFIPEILFEFKAHSSIDAPPDLFPPDNAMAKDILKMYLWSVKNNCDPDMYFVFFNNVLDSTSIPSSPPNLNKSIKYCDNQRVLHNISNSYKNKVLEVFQNWRRLLHVLNLPLELTSVVEIKAGHYYTIPVSVLAFIYGPFKKSNFKEIIQTDQSSKGNHFMSKTLAVEDNDCKFIFVNEDKRLDGVKLW